MDLFPQIGMSQMGGLFDGIREKLADPAVKAGFLQAGMSMLNPNPNSSPFAQIFTGIGEGAMAHQRYADLETQRKIENDRLLAEQQRQQMADNAKNALASARLAQIENSIKTSQQNSNSLTTLRAAQTERAKRAPGGGSGGLSSPWRRFYLKQMGTLLPGQTPTPEVVAQWKQQFDSLENGGGAASMPDTSTLDSATIQTLADEEGISFEEAQQILLGTQ